jgi:hypothetical protein
MKYIANEVWEIIFSFLDGSDLSNLYKVDTRFNYIFNHPRNYKLIGNISKDKIFKILKPENIIVNNETKFNYVYGSLNQNNIPVLKHLLKNNIISPSAKDNFIIKHAVKNNYFDMFKLVRSFDSVDLSLNNNNLIKVASGHGYNDIVKDILDNQKITDDNKNAIKESHFNAILIAQKFKRLETFKILFFNTDVKLSEIFTSLFINLIRYNKPEFIEFLMQQLESKRSSFSDADILNYIHEGIRNSIMFNLPKITDILSGFHDRLYPLKKLTSVDKSWVFHINEENRNFFSIKKLKNIV